MRERWSPRAFLDKPVEHAKLMSILEAARWAPSSYNEQPWFFLVGVKGTPEYQKIFGCLVEANQAWAGAAPVLMISVVKTTWNRDGKPNRTAVHDLGLASENMVLEAVAQGLCAHGMAGIDVDKVRESYKLPEHCEAMAAWAVGYCGEPEQLQGRLKDMEEAPRERKELKEFVFGDTWGKAANL